MPSNRTEASNPAARGLDLLSDVEITRLLGRGQQSALSALDGAISEISQAGTRMAQVVAAGGRLFYAAAGSSGLMALADAAELSGTFGIPTTQIRVLMAGGIPVDARMPGHTEDDADDARHDAGDIAAGDMVIAVSASGSTPYAMEVARIARTRGAAVVCIANNRGAAIFALADIAICLETPPEVLAGSTRMGAGSAQKAALNMMSTLMGVRLGHVHDGLMVNLVADNEKLRARAVDIVCQITDAPPARAAEAIAQARGAIKPAVLLVAGAADVVEATALLVETDGNLRAALARIQGVSAPQVLEQATNRNLGREK